MVTAAAAIDGAGIPTSRVYNCPGEMIIGGSKVYNYDGNSFGEIDMETAMIHSVNTYFAQLAVETGGQTLVEYAEAGGMNRLIPLDLPEVSQVFHPPGLADGRRAARGHRLRAGQRTGDPAADVHVRVRRGQRRRHHVPAPPEGRARPGEHRRAVRDQGVVPDDVRFLRLHPASDDARRGDRGDREGRAIPGHSVAGKTGTAEVEGQKDYTWFLGIADVQNPQIVVAVVVEASGGSGGSVAAPIARQVMEAALQ